jgi:CheY-like chemotaxis protein
MEMLSNDQIEKLPRILIAERRVGTRDLFTAVLTDMGYSVRTATSGAEALSCASDFKPTVVFTCVRLGDFDGIELCTKLRKIPSIVGTLVVAVSGCCSFDNLHRSGVEGFDFYLAEPTKVNIVDTMQHLRTIQVRKCSY